MKTLDELFAEIARRDLFISSLSERLDGAKEWEAMCALKRKDWTAYHFGFGRTIEDAIKAALLKFGSDRRAKAVDDEFGDLLG